ncbi:MAG: OmpA family protein, partial [Bacteroidota bacterium]
VLKMNDKYSDAIIELQQFISETDDPVKKELANNELIGAQLAMSLPENTKAVEVTHAGRNVNTRTSEYSATLNRTADKMYFVTYDTDEVVVMEEATDGAYAKVFMSEKTDKGWGKPTAISPKVNQPEVSTSSVSLSADGNTMYFTRAILKGNMLDRSRIYYSTGGDGNWSGAQEVQGINSNDYLVKHPAVGELFGSEVLFFSANIDGGEGGFDLFYSTRTGEGTYSKPVNLGSKLNSMGDEISPFYKDGTLYYSSNGLPGIGGYDIFYTTWDGTQWSEPQNMGAGFNSPVDDLYFRLDAEGYNGTLSSNRQGGRSVHSKTCCDDIYTFSIARLYADLVVGIFDADKKPLLDGMVILTDKMLETDEDKKNPEGNRFDFGLNLETPYKIYATKEGYFPDSIEITTVGLKESKTFEQRFFLRKKPVVVVPEEPEFDTITIEEAIVLENILYDFDSDRIRDESEPDLQLVYDLLIEYPEMKIELSSHTDYRGDDYYNERLSQRRAESARRWLIRKGIPRDRMEAVGYGEKVPQTVKSTAATQNDFLNEGDILTQGYIDSLGNEEEKETCHLINRRTEFKIIEGPTSIVIKRTRLRKKENSKQVPDKKSNIKDTVAISKMSTLYGKGVTKGVPILNVDERVIDFGTVERGDKRVHIYKIKNVGDTEAIISTIVHCECTTLERDFEVIQPGQEVELKVTFDSTEKEEAEEIDLDIILDNPIPGFEDPIIERLMYKFNIKK